MSKQVDQRVVEMQFDNKRFESNVQQSMSTLEKLKKSLRLDGAAKGFDNLDKAAKKVDVSPLGKGLETVSAKFSALQIMGVTALANITNSVVNSAKRWVSALTIAPVSDGFQEYEMTLNAIQTTMAGTGKTAKEVEKELKKLDEYADKTVYSTADMLNNLPKFTNAGVQLEDATKAMIGIANATALAGGDAGKASIAFYNLGQAIGTGYLTRMDYNSINNAGIATMQWKEEMIKAAIAQGTLTKVGENSYKAGKKTYTLQQLFIDGLQEQWATTDVMMQVFGDYGDETTEIGKKSYAAAQDIKTFSMMMDSLKATAGTGWKDTWQLIFGGLDEAKVFWTGLSNFISGIINKMADIRNGILEGALGKTFTGLTKTLDDILTPAKNAAKTVENVTNTVKDLGDVVDKVILGKFGNGKQRVEALTKAGYNFAEVQNKVNEKLGNSYRYTVDSTEAQGKAVKTTEKLTKADAELLDKLSRLSDAELENLGYSKEQIKAIRDIKKEADKLGISVKDFIENLDELNGRTILINSFKNIGKAISDVFGSIKTAFTDIFDLPNVSQVSQKLYDLIAGFHNLTMKMQLNEGTADKITRTFKGLFAAIDLITTVVGGPIKIAFKLFTKILQAFDLNILDITAVVGDAIVGFRDWIDSVLDFTEIFDKIAPVLSNCIDSVSGWISDMKEKFSGFGTNIMEGFTKGLGGGIKGVWKAIVDFGKSILDWFKEILGIHSPSTETEAMGKDLIQGLLNGISAAFWVLSAFITNLPILNVIAALASAAAVLMSDIGTKILEEIKKVLGINSPSKETHAIGVNIMEGLINGITSGIGKVVDAIKQIFSNILGTFENFDWNKLSFGSALLATLLPGQAKILGIIAAFSRYFNAAGVDASRGMIEGLKNGAKGIFDTIINIGKTIIDSICNVLGIHSPSKVFMAIGAFLIAGLIAGLKSDASGVFDTLKDIGINLFNFVKDAFLNILNFIKNISFGEILATALVVSFVVAVKKVMDIVNGFVSAAKGFGKMTSSAGKLMDAFAKKNKFESAANNMLKIAGAIAILAGSVWLLAQVKPGQMWSAVGAVVVLTGVIGGLAIAMDKLEVTGSDFGKITLLLVGVSLALLTMSRVMKTLAKMEWDEIGKAAAGLGGLLAFLTLMMLITKIGNSKKVGVMLMQMAGAILILTMVAKRIIKMEWSEMGKAAAGLGGMIAFLALLMLVTKIGNAKKVGSMLLQIAGSIFLLTMVAKMLAGMEWSEMGKAAVGLVALGGFLVGLMYITKIGNFKKVGTMLMAMAGAIAILALTARLIAGMEWMEMGKAYVGLLGLASIIALLVWSTKLAGGNDLKGVGQTLLFAAGAIGILALIAVILGMVDPNRLAIGVTAVTILGGLMAMLIIATERAQKCTGTIVALTICMAVLTGALWLLSTLPVNKALPAAAILAGVMLALAGSMWIISQIQQPSAKAIGALVVLTAALAVLAGALWLVSGIPTESLIPAGIALGVLMLALAGAMIIISNIQGVSVTALGALGIMTAALAVLAGALWLIAGMPIANAIVGALALSTLMLALSASMMLISGVGAGAIGGAAAMLLIAGALAILTPSLQTLGSMSLAQIGTGLLALAGAFAVIGVAGLLLGPIAPAIVVLAAAITLIGAGCLMAGTGVLSFVTALNMFLMTAMTMAGQGPTITAGITAIITGICMAIVNSVVAITTAITAVVAAICQCIITCVPMMLTTAGVALTAFLEFIVTYVPKMVVAGMKLIMGILQGIADNIGGIIDAATDIIVNFLNGISRNLPRVIDSGIKLVISFINGMADGIRGNSDTMISAVNNLMDAVISAIKKWFSNAVSKGGELVGKLVSGIKSKFGSVKSVAGDMMNGFLKGIGEKFGAIKEKAVNAVKGAVDAVKSFLGIKSPSRVFMQMGRYADEGMALGLQKYAKVAVNASKDLGFSVVEGMKNALDINSPAKVIKDEVGRYVVQGLAEGIKSDMSAEEAAEQKAKNIADAFKTEFDKINADTKTIDLEYKLWSSENESTASEADKLNKQISMLNDKVAKQQEYLKLAEGEYDVTLREFGKDHTKTMEAYNKYLQSKIDLVDLTGELTDATKNLTSELRDLDMETIDLEYELWLTSNESTATEVDKIIAKMNNLNTKITEQTKDVKESEQEYLNALNSYGKDDTKTKEAYNKLLQSKIDLATLTKEYTDSNDELITEQKKVLQDQRNSMYEYSQFIKNNKDALLEFGLTMEDVYKEAARVSGYDPEKMAQASKVVSSNMGQATEGINQATEDMKQSNATLQTTISDATTAMVSTCVDAMVGQKEEWINAGTQLVNGFIEGIRANTDKLGEIITEVMEYPISKITAIINGEIDVNPTIRPVLDLSQIQNGAAALNGLFNQQTLQLASINAAYSDGQMNAMSRMESQMKHMEDGNSKIVSAISSLKSDINDLGNKIAKMKICMNSGALVGEISSDMDSTLGQQVVYKGRGN